jgi:hypothetical protein
VGEVRKAARTEASEGAPSPLVRQHKRKIQTKRGGFDPMPKRTRRYGSVATELVRKAREAMLTAVQIFNNPQIEFKSELFIVTTTIAWTYLHHAYYRKKGIEYRRYEEGPQRRRFIRTKHGAVWHWSLEDCLNCKDCPLDDLVKKNLKVLDRYSPRDRTSDDQPHRRSAQRQVSGDLAEL